VKLNVVVLLSMFSNWCSIHSTQAPTGNNCLSFDVSVIKCGILFLNHRLFANFFIYNSRIYIWELKLIRVKINSTLIQALRLCTVSLADKSIRGIDLL